MGDTSIPNRDNLGTAIPCKEGGARMPWKEASPMSERIRFIHDHQLGVYDMTELCQRYGVSRKTGYKWLSRFSEGGYDALKDRSRSPHSCPHKTPDYCVEAILEKKRRHPFWGAKKIVPRLRGKYPDEPWPAISTGSAILERHGLVKSRGRARKRGHAGRPDTPMTEPNAVWTIDFKGQFKTRDGKYCYPLTVADGNSRFLLGCQGFLSPCLRDTKKTMTTTFRDYGLPSIIRSDNGTPFASSAIGRISRLSVWWIKLGIYPELIEPAHPEQNGRHERMHRTLKAETARPPAGNLSAQQRRFNTFRTEYNEERPHEALGQVTPASVYRPSTRLFPEHVPPIEYPGHFEVRRVSRNGGIRWNSRWVNMSHVLGGEYVGLEEVDNDLWNVYFGPLWLGRFHEKELKIEDALGRKQRRKVSPMYLE
jgi:putative transposase